MRFALVGVLAGLFATGFASGAAAQSWTFSSQRDAFTDRPTYRASQTSRRHSMNVRCKDDRLEVYLIIAGYLGDAADVRYRFDRGEVRTNTWDTSTDGSGVFAPGPGEFARSLMTASSLSFEVTGEYGSPELVQISLAGSAAAIGRVLDGCGVPRTEIYVEGGSIWRRPVEALDAMTRDDVEAVASLLSAMELYDGPVDNVRRRALYQSFSDFYSGYWSLCRRGTSLSQSCATWTSSRRYDPEADYPIEPAELLLEVVQHPTPAASGDATSAAVNWTRPPSPTYPDRALERGLSGSATLSCTVRADYTMEACSIVSETPAGAGFGRSALAAARGATVSPIWAVGRVGQAATFSIVFSLPPLPAPEATAEQPDEGS